MNAKAPKVRHVDPRNFLIVLVPIAIFVMEATIGDHFIGADLYVSPDIVRDDHGWLEASGRYRFLAATWIFVCITVLAVCLVAQKLIRPATRSTRITALSVWALVVVLGLSPTLLMGFGNAGPTAYGRIGGPVFEAALSRGTVPGCAAPTDIWLLGACGAMPAVDLFNAVIDLVNLLAGLSVGALIVGMILCLNNRPCETLDDEAALIADNLRDMRLQLYLSSLTLTFGMLFATSWMNWPAPLIVEDVRGSYSALVLSAAMFTGVFFTLLILSFYLPVALTLSTRARDLARRAEFGDTPHDAFDAESWLSKHNLKEGPAEHIRAGVALAAPVLSAFAGGFIPIPT